MPFARFPPLPSLRLPPFQAILSTLLAILSTTDRCRRPSSHLTENAGACPPTRTAGKQPRGASSSAGRAGRSLPLGAMRNPSQARRAIPESSAEIADKSSGQGVNPPTLVPRATPNPPEHTPPIPPSHPQPQPSTPTADTPRTHQKSAPNHLKSFLETEPVTCDCMADCTHVPHVVHAYAFGNPGIAGCGK